MIQTTYNIVKARGEEIQVESEQNKRTEFIVTLPI